MMFRIIGWVALALILPLGAGCKKDPYNKPPDLSSAPTERQGATGVMPSSSDRNPTTERKSPEQPQIPVARADSDDDSVDNPMLLQKPMKVRALPTISLRGKKKDTKKKKKKEQESLSFGVGGLQMDPSLKGMFGKPSGSLLGGGGLSLSGGNSLNLNDDEDDEDDTDDAPASQPTATSQPATSRPVGTTLSAGRAKVAQPSSRPVARQPAPRRASSQPVKDNAAAPIQSKTSISGGAPGLQGPFADAQKAPTLPKILAKVNDEPVDRWSYVQILKEMQRLWVMKAGFPPSGAMLTELRRQSVKRLIDQQLVYQKAQQEGLALSGAEIREGLQMFFSRFPKPTTVEDYVRDQGMSRAKFMEIMKRQLLVRKYMMSLAKQVPVKREEIISYYKKNMGGDSVRARQIVVSIEKGKEEESKTKALKVLKLAQQEGANFVSLVKQYSDDPSKDLDGDIGTLKRGDLLPALENVLFALKKGQVGGPVQTNMGYHILQVVQRKRAKPLRQVQMKIVEKLQMKRLEVILKKQVKELREDGNIEIFVPWAKD